MDQRIEGDDPGPGVIRVAEGGHVALPELDVGIQTASLSEHALGEIDSRDVDAALAEIACDVTGPAAEIADGPDPLRRGGEAVEQLPVERLVRELVGDAAGVFV